MERGRRKIHDSPERSLAPKRIFSILPVDKPASRLIVLTSSQESPDLIVREQQARKRCFRFQVGSYTTDGRTGLVASRPTSRHVPYHAEPMKLEKLGQKGSKETVTDDHIGIILVNGKLSWYRKPVAPRGTGSRRGTARILENIAYSLHVPWEPSA